MTQKQNIVVRIYSCESITYFLAKKSQYSYYLTRIESKVYRMIWICWMRDISIAIKKTAVSVRTRSPLIIHLAFLKSAIYFRCCITVNSCKLFYVTSKVILEKTFEGKTASFRFIILASWQRKKERITTTHPEVILVLCCPLPGPSGSAWVDGLH